MVSFPLLRSYLGRGNIFSLFGPSECSRIYRQTWPNWANRQSFPRCFLHRYICRLAFFALGYQITRRRETALYTTAPPCPSHFPEIGISNQARLTYCLDGEPRDFRSRDVPRTIRTICPIRYHIDCLMWNVSSFPSNILSQVGNNTERLS